MSRACGRDRWVWQIRDLVPSTEASNVLPAMRTCLNVRDILATSSLPCLFFMLVCDANSSSVSQLAYTNVISGFMTKIKKILETVCHNCGKILVDEVSHPQWDGRCWVVCLADNDAF